mmetsp:Transcript_5371/g.11351  ORF Transcript_5371/g.11351 Transcript_5371/m.11351 type:complete len:256 (+) Transcript_5371:1860-2627(+)
MEMASMGKGYMMIPSTERSMSMVCSSELKQMTPGCVCIVNVPLGFETHCQGSNETILRVTYNVISTRPLILKRSEPFKPSWHLPIHHHTTSMQQENAGYAINCDRNVSDGPLSGTTHPKFRKSMSNASTPNASRTYIAGPVHWKSRFFKAAMSCMSMITCPAVRKTVTWPNLCRASEVCANNQVIPLNINAPSRIQSKGSTSTPLHASHWPFVFFRCQALQLLHALPLRPGAQVPSCPAGHSRALRQRYTERDDP